MDGYATEEPLQVHVLKTVGILNLLNDDLFATEESIVCAIAGDDNALQRQVRLALDKPQKVKRVLCARGRGLARLSSDGTLDTTFNPNLGYLPATEAR